jgi:hypothetical protein
MIGVLIRTLVIETSVDKNRSGVLETARGPVKFEFWFVIVVTERASESKAAVGEALRFATTTTFAGVVVLH